MKRIDINDDDLVMLYNTGTPMPELEKPFAASHTVLYAHLKKNGARLNRKASLPWTPTEEDQLIAARAANCTGQEYGEWIPTRSLAAIKSYIKTMRERGRMQR